MSVYNPCIFILNVFQSLIGGHIFLMHVANILNLVPNNSVTFVPVSRDTQNQNKFQQTSVKDFFFFFFLHFLRKFIYFFLI